MTPLRASIPAVAAVILTITTILVLASFPDADHLAITTPSGDVLTAAAGEPVAADTGSPPNIGSFSGDWTAVLADWKYRQALDAAVAESREKARVATIEYAAALHAERQRQTALAATPSPAPAPVTTPIAPSGSCGGYGDLLAAHFGSAAGQACTVMMCESNGNINAHNSRSSASGLFQFLDSTWTSTTGLPPEARDYSADTQIAAAAKLWRSSGWSPWVCKP